MLLPGILHAASILDMTWAVDKLCPKATLPDSAAAQYFKACIFDPLLTRQLSLPHLMSTVQQSPRQAAVRSARGNRAEQSRSSHCTTYAGRVAQRAHPVVEPVQPPDSLICVSGVLQTGSTIIRQACSNAVM